MTQITIRNVPAATRDELAARAALKGMSMQEFLLAELVKLTKKPSIERWLVQVAERKAVSANRVTPKEILDELRADSV